MKPRKPSRGGARAIPAFNAQVLGPGDFFGEECLAGKPVRVGCATAISPSVMLFVARHIQEAGLHRLRG